MNNYINTITEKLSQEFSPEVISLALVDGSLNVIIGLIVLIVFYFLWSFIQIILNFTVRKKMDKTSFSFLKTIVKFTFICIAVVSALDSAGIKTSAILASLGVAGLTIGFAAKDALSNLISGVLIFIDRPFVLGDLVEIEGVYGQVDNITLRSTRVVTADGKMLAVPNTEIINKTVASYTNFPHLRIDIKVTIAPSENIAKVRDLLLNIVLADIEYMKEKPAKVVVSALNDYNICLELQAWLRDEKAHINKRFELREKVFNILTEQGIEMPYQTFRIQSEDIK